MKQNLLETMLILTVYCALMGCGNRLEEKGFAVTPEPGSDETEVDGISKDSLLFPTKPSSVLLTGIPQYRLATVYKINYNKDKSTFIGNNDYIFNYSSLGETKGNQWNHNYLPGFEAVYGYNMVNVSHYNTETQRQKTFFEKPVLIKTLYYPAFSKDTLNYQPVHRNFYMISVYDEDTNKDGYINLQDLRHFYHLDIDASTKRALIPSTYSVYKSEYDPANDFLYIFAQLDANADGRTESKEPVHVFWIDLKNPERVGRQY